MANPVVHFEIVGKDLDKLKGFYEGAFGWQVDTNNPINYGMVAPGSERGIGGGIGAAPDGQARATFYIEVEDPQASLNQIESMGGKTVMPVTEIPNMVTLALFQDPEGNVIGLVKSQST